jgi:WD40 repeat protein
VTALAVNADGRWVISASEDKTLKVWNLESGYERCTLAVSRRGVTAVVVTPDGRSAISASEDKTLKTGTSDGAGDEHFHSHTNTVNGVAIAPDGHFCNFHIGRHHAPRLDLADGRTIARLKARAPS